MDNMREKYESLSVAALKDLAKARGLKRFSLQTSVFTSLQTNV